MDNFEDIFNATLYMDDYGIIQRHSFASDDHYRLFRSRLEDPDEKDEDGRTFLHIAVEGHMGNFRTMQLLIDRVADLDATTKDGHTALHLAVMKRKHDNVYALITAGASVNSKDSAGKTALHYSINSGGPDLEAILNFDYDIKIFEMLIKHPEIIVDPTDDNGETPLMWAVKERNARAVMALLKKGANPNISNKHQRSPLHEALSSESPVLDIVVSLLTNGAGINSVDNHGHSPIDLIVRIVRDDRYLSFAANCIRLIAFRYNISESIKRKLGRFPDLLNCLNACCKEVRLMKKVIVHDSVNLHDFCLDCFQTRDRDAVRDTYIPVVEILLTGVFKTCSELIFNRFSKQDWHEVLERTVPRPLYHDMVLHNASNSAIVQNISYVYNSYEELMQRLQRLKLFLNKLKKI